MKVRGVTWVLAVCACIFLRSVEAQVSHPLPGNDPGQSSPAVADLDGDASNGLETVIGSLDGRVQALRSDGTLLWSRELPNFSCPFAPSNDKLYSSPVVGDLFGNGEQHVVIGYGGFRGKPCDGGVAAFRGRDGATTWTFSIKTFAKRRGFFAFRHAVYGTPALGDVDGDGRLEVGFGSFDRNVYLLNSNGKPRWYYNAADTVFPSPLFLDVDGDRELEMIIGTDISQNTRIKPPTPNGGFLYALEAAAKVPQGGRFLFRDPNLVQWKTEFDQVMQSTPVAADLLPESPGNEIVVGSGCFFPQSGADRHGKWYKVVSARTGAVLRTLNVTACTPSGAAVGDVNGDGSLDVVVSVSGDPSAGGDGRSHLVAWNPASDQVLWDIQPKVGGRTDRFGGHFKRSPVIADLEGDGTTEVLIAQSVGVAIVDGASGAHLTCEESPCEAPVLRGGTNILGHPVVADTDGDGALEVIIGGRSGRLGALVRWEELSLTR